MVSRATRVHRVTSAVMVTALLVAASQSCSSDGGSTDTSSASTGPVSTQTVKDTLVQAASTSSPAETTAITVEVTTTTVAADTSTSPPPTTTAPPVTPEDAVRQGIRDFLAEGKACLEEPSSCDPSSWTASQGPARASATEYYPELVRLELHASPDQRGSYTVIESVEFIDPTTAIVEACGYDAGIMLGAPGPDGQPTVVNDRILSSRVTYTMYLEDGRWLVGETSTVELGEGNLCPPEA